MANTKGNQLLVQTPTSAVKDWMMDLRQALFDAVAPEDVTAIAKGLVERAKKGDLAATKVLLTYVVGNPSISVKQVVITPQQAPPAGDRTPLGFSVQAPTRDTSISLGGRSKIQDCGDPHATHYVIGERHTGEQVILAEAQGLDRAEKACKRFARLEDYARIFLEPIAREGAKLIA